MQLVTHDERGVTGAIDGIGQWSLERLESGNVTRPQLGVNNSRVEIDKAIMESSAGCIHEQMKSAAL